MSTYSTRVYNELYIGTRNGQSMIDSNIDKSRQRSITWATKNNRIHYFDPRKSIIFRPSASNTSNDNDDYLEFESESEFDDDTSCTESVCILS